MIKTLEKLKAGELIGTSKLKLSCGLKIFPSEIFELAGTLEILDLSGNHLSDLPDEFYHLRKLKILFLSDNHFTKFPSILSRCINLEIIGFKANRISQIAEGSFPPKLRWLILTNNHLQQLPASLGKCNLLQKLMLAGNHLTSLPPEMAKCKNLQLIRISANKMNELPSWLFSLPKLSWLAFAGNPYSSSFPICKNLSKIPWTELNLQEKLGEGASGTIFRANWLTTNIQEVAVKIFKGEVTSDGLPSDEIYSSIVADNHHNLVKVLGQISEHPLQKIGLVFELIPSTYRNLGDPPNFETCTRDTYKEGSKFSIKKILWITTAICSTITHIHAQGLMHGDLYAHNILIDETTSHTLLGDFGAGTIYKNDSALSSLIERIEVRAFGCLLEDLLERVESFSQDFEIINSLMILKNECMVEEVLNRPNFKNISKKILELKESFYERLEL